MKNNLNNKKFKNYCFIVAIIAFALNFQNIKTYIENFHLFAHAGFLEDCEKRIYDENQLKYTAFEKSAFDFINNTKENSRDLNVFQADCGKNADNNIKKTKKENNDIILSSAIYLSKKSIFSFIDTDENKYYNVVTGELPNNDFYDFNLEIKSMDINNIDKFKKRKERIYIKDSTQDTIYLFQERKIEGIINSSVQITPDDEMYNYIFRNIYKDYPKSKLIINKYFTKECIDFLKNYLNTTELDKEKAIINFSESGSSKKTSLIKDRFFVQITDGKTIDNIVLKFDTSGKVFDIDIL